MPAKKEKDSAFTVTNAVVESILSVPLTDLEPCPMNPRGSLGELGELADSIRERGILEPLIVRKGKKRKYEVVAGHRRIAAANIVGNGILVPVIVRELTDDEVMATMLVENTQRQDLHPLEEALLYVEFAKTMSMDGVAKAVGKTYNYVWDRVQLTKLIPAARKMFLKNEFSLGHAVLISRLTPEKQAEVIVQEGHFGSRGGPLFVEDLQPGLAWDEENDRKPIWKTKSVNELRDWIDNHVRFDPKEKVVPHLFPEAAEKVKEAEAAEMKVVAITHGYVQPEARDENERTFGPASWKRADGKEGSKICEHQVMGVIKAGAGRGETFLVCVDKKKCKVHWSKEIAKSKKSEKQSTSDERAAAQRKREEAERQKEKEKWNRIEKRRTLWRSKAGLIQQAVLDRITEQGRLPGDMAKAIVYSELGVTKKELALLPSILTKDPITHLAAIFLHRAVARWQAAEQFPPVAKKLGIDVEKILAPVKEGKSAKPTKKKGAKK